MNLIFSRRADSVKASEVRELLKLTETKEIISFGGGLPAEETFPTEKMKIICEEILSVNGAKSMQYSSSEGLRELREVIAGLMEEKGVTADADNVLITSGSQQGLDLTAKVFIDEGDLIACESPTYLAAINAFKPFYPRFVDIAMDDKGMIMEDLEDKLKRYKGIKFLYTIPDYQNPTGVTLSVDRRRGLMDIANKYDIIVVEDNPYSELRFEGAPLPPLKSFDTEGRVIYLSTFSKTVCPGYRIGWVYASKEILNKYILLKQGTDLHTNIFSQMQIASFFKKFDVRKHIDNNIRIYKSRRDTMLKAIKSEFPEVVKYTEPEGGLFLWLTLPKYMDSRVLLQKALEKGVAFVPGGAFFPNGGNENTIRVNYSGLTEDTILKGIKILAQVIKEQVI